MSLEYTQDNFVREIIDLINTDSEISVLLDWKLRALPPENETSKTHWILSIWNIQDLNQVEQQMRLQLVLIWDNLDTLTKIDRKITSLLLNSENKDLNWFSYSSINTTRRSNTWNPEKRLVFNRDFTITYYWNYNLNNIV